MVKKYLLFVKKKWETIEICPHPPPTDPFPGKAERSGKAVEKQNLKAAHCTEVEGVPKNFYVFPICPETNKSGSKTLQFKRFNYHKVSVSSKF